MRNCARPHGRKCSDLLEFLQERKVGVGMLEIDLVVSRASANQDVGGRDIDTGGPGATRGVKGGTPHAW